MNFYQASLTGPGYTPFIRIEGSPVVYSAPIVATGDGPFDVETHTNTHDRVLGIHIAEEPSPPGQFLESWVDMLFVKGFDAGEPIIYISTDAGQPDPAVLERSTLVQRQGRRVAMVGDGLQCDRPAAGGRYPGADWYPLVARTGSPVHVTEHDHCSHQRSVITWLEAGVSGFWSG